MDTVNKWHGELPVTFALINVSFVYTMLDVKLWSSQLILRQLTAPILATVI
jgi:hypothetical protein